jgi:hypothetical protein
MFRAFSARRALVRGGIMPCNCKTSIEIPSKVGHNEEESWLAEEGFFWSMPPTPPRGDNGGGDRLENSWANSLKSEDCHPNALRWSSVSRLLNIRNKTNISFSFLVRI